MQICYRHIRHCWTIIWCGQLMFHWYTGLNYIRSHIKPRQDCLDGLLANLTWTCKFLRYRDSIVRLGSLRYDLLSDKSINEIATNGNGPCTNPIMAQMARPYWTTIYSKKKKRDTIANWTSTDTRINAQTKETASNSSIF